MNEYIINPWLIYLADILPCLGFFCVISGIVTIALACVASSESDKAARNLVIISLVLFFIDILIPSRETIYSMAIASQVTTENIEIAKDTIKSGVDYIFEKMEVLD